MVTLSGHAETQIEERGIARAWIEAACAAPDRIEPDPIAGRQRCFRAIPKFGGRILRVVVETRNADVHLITAHFARAATKRRHQP